VAERSSRLRARAVRVGPQRLPASLTWPSQPASVRGLIVCTGHVGTAGRSGISRLATSRPTSIPTAGAPGVAREAALVRVLSQYGLATLFVDLLEAQEGPDARLGHDLLRLTQRAVETLDWVAGRPDLSSLRTGLCASGVLAAVALKAAVRRSAHVSAVVLSSGRPDLAGPDLARVAAPTLMIVGGMDLEALGFNRAAMLALACEKRLEVVPGAAQGFAEPGALEAMAHMAGAWLAGRLPGPARH
jgi:hypothetical protein